MASTEHMDDAPLRPQPQLPVQRVVEVMLIVLVFFAIAGDPPPHVNEAHYLARLKHFWNPQWCAGDLFLESNEAQLVFAWTFGWVTHWLSLEATAWLGRLLAWTLLAVAWQRLSWRVVPRPLASVLSAALFVTLNAWAHLAGEWIVGGVEAKCFAYAFVLLALTELIDRRWNRMWLLLGAATAFHPIVGGWSAVVCGGIWLWDTVHIHLPRLAKGWGASVSPSPQGWRAIVTTAPGLAGFAVLASFGVLPALLLTWNEPSQTVAEASRIYVFERLPHHLALLALPAGEIVQRLSRHALLLIVLWLLSRYERGYAPRCLAHFAWSAAILAVVGFAIELALWNEPLVAARLLRYYWFRLTDFAAPMAVALHFTALVAVGLNQQRTWAAWLLTVALVFVGWHVSQTARQRVLEPVPPADAKMRDFAAWVEACEWVAANTPADALFLTPRLNHSFKWRTGRPEVVNRKDIPQDAASIVEWHRRIEDIYYTELEAEKHTLDSLGILGTERVQELAKKYRAEFVIMDRGQLLSLPRAFWNEEYVVYRVED